jgi:2-desacetyl-2-hydroxyethyl bacteriochlorophyllide A dehydrogenase
VKIEQLVIPEKGLCEVETVELDEKLDKDTMLVRNRASLMSPGTELSFFCGTHRGLVDGSLAWAKYPYRTGYAAVGEVVAGAGPFKPGDRIFHTGLHATMAKVQVSKAVAVPANLSNELAVFYRLATIAMTSPRIAPAKLGENVVVIGAGMVGNLAAQLYALGGAGMLAVADRSAARLEIAGRCGLELRLNVAETPLSQQLSPFGKRGAELVIDAVGAPPTIAEALKIVAVSGRVVLLGSPRVKQEIDPYFDIHHRGCSVIGAHERLVDPAVRAGDAPLLMNWLAAGRLKAQPLMTHRIRLAQAHQAYEGLRDKTDEYLGVVIEYP